MSPNKGLDFRSFYTNVNVVVKEGGMNVIRDKKEPSDFFTIYFSANCPLTGLLNQNVFCWNCI